MDVAEEIVGQVVAEAKSEVPTSSSSSERRRQSETFEGVSEDEEDRGGPLPQVGEFMRTNTDVTLIGGNEESCDLALKAQWFLPVEHHN